MAGQQMAMSQKHFLRVKQLELLTDDKHNQRGKPSGANIRVDYPDSHDQYDTQPTFKESGKLHMKTQGQNE